MIFTTRKPASEAEQGNQAAWEAYADKYIEGVERLHRIGGFALVVFCIGVALIFLAAGGSVFNDSLRPALPYLVVASTLIALAGIVLHILEVRHKEAAYQKSLDNYYRMASQLWGAYVEKLSQQSSVDSRVLGATMGELHRIINHKESGDRP